MNLKITE